MGKKNKKKGSFWKEVPNKAAAPEVEEEFPVLGLTHVPPHVPTPANCPPDVSALASMATNDLKIQKKTDPGGKSE